MKTISQFYNQLGGDSHFSILIIFILGFFLINSAVKHKVLRLTTSFFSSIFISAQAFSLYSTQSFIGYQFYVHMNLRGVVGMQNLFVSQIITLLLFLITLVAVNFYSHSIWRKINHKINSEKTLAILRGVSLLAITSMLFLGKVGKDFVEDTMTLKSVIVTNDAAEFEEILLKYNMSDYIASDELESAAGKNIIIISMESIERGFLNKKHSSLIPNLIQLKTQWNYMDIDQNCGSGWTSGSLYTYLTGFPAFFGPSGNNIFQGSYYSNISSISQLLKQSNYQTTYLNGNTEHSGVNYMLSVFQFDKVIDTKNTPKSGNESVYGLRDKDLFTIAKSEINSLKDSKNPYALFISTTDSHFPDGIYDSRMESAISPKKSDFEFTVASLDYLIGNFVSYLKENDILKNTVVYIFPDHLKMGDPKMFNNTGERGLYLITNAKDEDIEVASSNKIYQIDLPNIILNGAKIEHNLKFLTDYISGDKDQYIRNNINAITEINRAGLLRSNVKKYVAPTISKHYEEYKKDTFRYIAHAGGIIDGFTYTNSLEALNLSYEKGFRLFELDIMKTKDGKYVAIHDWERWKQMTEYIGETPVAHQEFMKHKLHKTYNPLSMNEINIWFKNHPDAILVSDKINEPELFSKAFIDPNRLMMELFSKEAVEKGCKTEMLSSIATQGVIESLSWDEIINLGLKHAAVSRFSIQKNKELLKKLKEADIKVYVYNVNQNEGVIDSGMDEEYVTKYELDYAYGMYADKWNF